MDTNLLNIVDKAIQARSRLIIDNDPKLKDAPSCAMDGSSWYWFITQIHNKEAEQQLLEALAKFNDKTNSMINGTDYDMQEWKK